jgi:hypothetical protein
MKNPAAFVRVTAIVFLVLGILCLLGDSLAFLMFHFVFRDSPIFANTFQNLGPVQAWRMAHMDFYLAFHFFICLGGVVCCVGMLNQKSWAPSGFVVVLAFLILVHLSNLGFSVASILTLPDQASINGMPYPKGLMALSTGFGAVWALVMVGIYGWLWFSFRKPEVQKVFG